MATSPREMGNQAKHSVEQAAERLNRAAGMLEGVLQDRVLRAETETDINAALVEIHLALRWLERIGASTLPREI